MLLITEESKYPEFQTLRNNLAPWCLAMIPCHVNQHPNRTQLSMLFKGKFCINRYIFNTDDLNQPKPNASKLWKYSIHSHALCMGVSGALTTRLQEGRMIQPMRAVSGARAALCRPRTPEHRLPRCCAGTCRNRHRLFERSLEILTRKMLRLTAGGSSTASTNGKVCLGSKWQFLSAAVDISYAEVCKSRNPGAPWSPKSTQNYLLVCHN